MRWPSQSLLKCQCQFFRPGIDAGYRSPPRIFESQCRVLDNTVLLLVSIASGFVLKRTLFREVAIASMLNRLIIYFFIPLIAVYQVPKIHFGMDLIWLTLTPFIVFGLSFLFFQLIGPATAMSRETQAALTLTAGISSTSFVGFPIFEVLYGEEGLAYGVFLSLGGTIMVFNTVGIITLFYYSEGRTSLGSMIKKIVTFFPFIAFVFAIFLNVFSFPLPSLMDRVLGKLVEPFTVVALLSIGAQINFKVSPAILKELFLGQFFKLLLAPLFIYFLVWHFLGIHSILGKVCILGAAIGSMNAMSILTADKGLNPKLAILMPAIGIPFSIPILFLVDYLLG